MGSLQVDLILSEQHGLVSDVTDHPTQYGEDITDHIQKRLRVGNLKALVSNYSLNRALENGQAATQDIIESAYNSVQQSNPAKDAWETLKGIWDRSQLVDIVTVMEIYSQVAITNVGMMRDAENGEAQTFDISFKEVRRVRLQEQTVSAEINPSDMANDLNRLASRKSTSGVVVGVPSISISSAAGGI